MAEISIAQKMRLGGELIKSFVEQGGNLEDLLLFGPKTVAEVAKFMVICAEMNRGLFRISFPKDWSWRRTLGELNFGWTSPLFQGEKVLDELEQLSHTLRGTEVLIQVLGIPPGCGTLNVLQGVGGAFEPAHIIHVVALKYFYSSWIGKFRVVGLGTKIPGPKGVDCTGCISCLDDLTELNAPQYLNTWPKDTLFAFIKKTQPA